MLSKALASILRMATAATLIASVGSAAANAQVLTTIEFSFSNPGARSLALGGAFVALADDATAAFANPAGLVQITEPEVSLEGRSWHYSSPYTTGGRASGEPSGLGIDTVPHPLRGKSTVDLSGLSFVSVVYPAHAWSFAFYQHQLMNFEMTQEIQGIFEPGAVFNDSWRGPIERGSFDLEIVTRTLAAGYRLSDRLSLGLGLSYFDPEALVVGDEYLPDDDSVAAYFGPASFLAQRLETHVTGRISGGDWGLTAGILWSLGRGWQLGGVYRDGPRLGLDLEVTAGPALLDVPAGSRIATGSSPWHFPDVYGLGLSHRTPDGHWALGVEWTHVEYSTAIDSLAPELSTDQSINDADELHFGAEYAFFVGRSVMAARLGAWHDPNHLVAGSASNPLARAEAAQPSDELHATAGFGIALERIQIDLGADLSKRKDTISLSAIYSF